MSRNVLRKMFRLDIIDELSEIPHLASHEKNALNRASFLSRDPSSRGIPSSRFLQYRRDFIISAIKFITENMQWLVEATYPLFPQQAYECRSVHVGRA